MNPYKINTGACSIVLGSGHYGSFVPVKKNKLFKVTKIFERHDEFKYLSDVREIEGYENYFSIPDEEMRIIKSDTEFYNNLIKLTQFDNMSIFDGDLSGFYITDAGDNDMINSLVDMEMYGNFNFWKSYKIIYGFMGFMLDALSFLHKKNICHLDIKPENIMVNRITNQFRIIDFGFASKEPFSDYLKDIRGTPGYFPKYLEFEKPTPWLPKIKANDMIPVNGIIPFISNPSLVYKIDSYCLGRVFYYLKCVYDSNKQYTCFNMERKLGNKIDKIISTLTENDVFKRLTITECRDMYFEN